MPNGDPTYKIGELSGALEMLTKEMEQIKQRLDRIDKRLAYIEQLRGAIGLTKWLVGILGAGTIANMILWVVSYWRI